MPKEDWAEDLSSLMTLEVMNYALYYEKDIRQHRQERRKLKPLEDVEK